MKNDNTISPSGENWSDYRAKHYSPEELVENDLIVELVGEIIKARNVKRISQRTLEDLSGVKQPVIARMESGVTDPQLSTVIKILSALGKKLVIADK